MALAAPPIVVLIARLFNRLGLDVGICPRIQLQAVEPDALFPDREFPHVWAHGLVEFIPAHAEIPVGLTCPDEPGQDWRYLGCAFVCHRHSSALPTVGRLGLRFGRYCDAVQTIYASNCIARLSRVSSARGRMPGSC